MNPTRIDNARLDEQLCEAAAEYSRLVNGDPQQFDHHFISGARWMAERKDKETVEMQRFIHKKLAEVWDLQSKLDAIKADSERLDWMIENDAILTVRGIRVTTKNWSVKSIRGEQEERFETPREAIDAAMKEHRAAIAPKEGGMSLGVCKDCGAQTIGGRARCEKCRSNKHSLSDTSLKKWLAKLKCLLFGHGPEENYVEYTDDVVCESCGARSNIYAETYGNGLRWRK